MIYQEINGDLIKLAKEGTFDVIAHGCNCHCTMGAGLAPQMAKAFGCNEFTMEADEFKGDINKLGTIDYDVFSVTDEGLPLVVINCYTQYKYGTNHLDGEDKPLDYNALALCFKKINHIFKGKHIGLPQIGCHLAGGDWKVVKKMIKDIFKDCIVTIVNYKP